MQPIDMTGQRLLLEWLRTFSHRHRLLETEIDAMANDKIDALVATVQTLTDREIWLLAVTMVSFAGQRAQHTGQDSVETACVDFVDEMHRLVGTPPVRDLTVN